MKRKSFSLTKSSLVVALYMVVAIFTRFSSGVVPFSFLPLVVVLSAFFLTPREAIFAPFAYLSLGLMGLPVFASPPFGGIAYLLRPTFGYLLGYIFASGGVAYLKDQFLGKGFFSFLLISLAGIGLIYPPGILYLWFCFNYILAQTLSGPDALRLGFFPFIVPDLVKGLLAAFLAWKMVPRIETVRWERH